MRRALAAAFVAALALVTLAPAASAANAVVIRKLDVTQFPKVTISAQVSGDAPDLGSFTLRENQQILSDFTVVPIGQTDTPVGIVLVVDISGSMRRGGKLLAAKEAAKQFVASKLANDQIAVVAFNDAAQVVAGFTNDSARLNQAIDGLAATGETALFDGVRTAATLFADRPDLQANIVVLSDGKDTVSRNGVAEAEASVVGAKAALYAVGLRGGEFDAASLTRLAQASGGRYTETTDTQQLSSLYGAIQRDLQNQYEISYTSAATTGSVAVALTVPGAQASAGPVAAGSVAQGSNARPDVVGVSKFAKPFGNSVWRVAIAVLAFIAVAIAVVGIAALNFRGGPTLSATLQPYGPGGGAAFEAGRAQEFELAQTAIVRRAVEATARLASGRGLLDATERKLEQADLPVRAAEGLFFYGASLLVGTVVAGLLWGFFGAAVALILLGLAPPAVLNLLGERRRAKFTSQLPDVLRVLASSLRAGFSLLQAADAAAGQVDDPMGKELRRVLVEARLGRPLELALQDSARRAQSDDYDWAVMAIGIQREVGGNLAELLSTVADTMVARERLRREVRTLTAEGRISAIVLAILPVAIGGVVYLLNRDYLNPLLHRTSGQFMLLGALAVGIAGFVWMRKIVNIEI